MSWIRKLIVMGDAYFPWVTCDGQRGNDWWSSKGDHKWGLSNVKGLKKVKSTCTSTWDVKLVRLYKSDASAYRFVSKASQTEVIDSGKGAEKLHVIFYEHEMYHRVKTEQNTSVGQWMTFVHRCYWDIVTDVWYVGVWVGIHMCSVERHVFKVCVFLCFRCFRCLCYGRELTITDVM